MVPEIPGFGLWEGWLYAILISVMIVGAGRDRTLALSVVRTIGIAALVVWIHLAFFYGPYYDYPSWFAEASAGVLLSILLPFMVLLKKFGDQADSEERKAKDVT